MRGSDRDILACGRRRGETLTNYVNSPEQTRPVNERIESGHKDRLRMTKTCEIYSAPHPFSLFQERHLARDIPEKSGQFGEYENMSYFTIRNTTIGAARVETEDSRRYGEAKKSAQNSPRRIQIFRERITYVCLRIIVSQNGLAQAHFRKPGKAESNSDERKLLVLSPYSVTASRNSPLFSRGHNSRLHVIIARRFTGPDLLTSKPNVYYI